MKSLRLTVIFILALTSITSSVLGQQLPKNLIYGNKRLLFQEVIPIGDYMMLRFTHQKRQNQRFVYLLDKSNIPTDTLKVLGNDHFAVHSDSTFSIRGLNEYVEVQIAEGQFKTTRVIQTQADFSSKIIDLSFLTKEFLIGSKYIGSRGCSDFYYAQTTEVRGLQATVNKNAAIYGIGDVDTLLILSKSTYEKTTGQEIALNLKPLFPGDNACEKRLKSPVYGQNQWVSAGDAYYFYERNSGEVYKLQLGDEIKVEKKITLPIKAKTEGWKYLFDREAQEHFVVKRIEGTANEAIHKKRRKKENVYNYELYKINWDQERLESLYKLPFEPIGVHNSLIYEIIKESKKGSALYFHPLDPNYQYNKSTLIYSPTN